MSNLTSIATRGYIAQSVPISIATRGYLDITTQVEIIFGNGIVEANSAIIKGLGYWQKVNLEIRRIFNVSMGLTQSFVTKIAVKMKFKVNK
jgi:hypothetical protein